MMGALNTDQTIPSMPKQFYRQTHLIEHIVKYPVQILVYHLQNDWMLLYSDQKCIFSFKMG